MISLNPAQWGSLLALSAHHNVGPTKPVDIWQLQRGAVGLNIDGQFVAYIAPDGTISHSRRFLQPTQQGGS